MLPLLRTVPSRLSARLLRLSVSPLSRLLSTAESHPDFAPRSKAPATPDAVFERVRTLIKSKPVVLFMKGSPSAPQCGFSAQVVRVLNTHGVNIHGEDVLRDASLRSSMKEFSKWPTFPQLYVNGEFVGGCDIVTQMNESGELKTLLAGVSRSSPQSQSQ